MLCIIGGTGFYEINDIEIIDTYENIETPFGVAKTTITVGKINNNTFCFMPRHGKGHESLPHEINYRANIFALKKIGVTNIITFSAVGSLKEEIKPGDFAIAEQYFDHIKGNREKTFFGNGLVAHISTAMPVSKQLVDWIYNNKPDDINLHKNACYVCVDGPRLGTKAESNFFRQNGFDIVGMTNVPEVFLAREAQISYCTIGIITDYDCWKENEDEFVSSDIVIKNYFKSLDKIKNMIMNIITGNIPNTDNTRMSLDGALLSNPENLSSLNKEIYNILKK